MPVFVHGDATATAFVCFVIVCLFRFFRFLPWSQSVKQTLWHKRQGCVCLFVAFVCSSFCLSCVYLFVCFLLFFKFPPWSLWDRPPLWHRRQGRVCLFLAFVCSSLCLFHVCLFVYCFLLHSYLGPCETGHLSDIGGEAVVGVLRHAHGVRDPVDRAVDHVHRISHLIWWKIHEAVKLFTTNFRFLDADGPFSSVKYICIASLFKEISPSINLDKIKEHKVILYTVSATTLSQDTCITWYSQNMIALSWCFQHASNFPSLWE